MADIPNRRDMVVSISNADNTKQADVVDDEDSEQALKVKGNVNISGSSGSQFVLSIANRIETGSISSTGNNWDAVLNLTVPVDKVWYLKSFIVGTGKAASWRVRIGPSGSEVVKVQGKLDANDSLEYEMHGYQVPENYKVWLEMNCRSNNQSLQGNLIILEEDEV